MIEVPVQEALEEGIHLQHPLQEVVLVHEQNAQVIHDHFEHEKKIIIPKDVKVEVEPIPVNKTKEVMEVNYKVPETTQYVMSKEDFEKQYKLVSAEESYEIAKFGNYAMLAGIIAMGAVSYKVVPAILRRIGFIRQPRINVFSPNPELTEMFAEDLYEEAALYSTPKRTPLTRLRTPKLKTP